MSDSDHRRRIETQLIHAGEPSPRIAGAVAMPVFQSSTFVYGGAPTYHDVRYIRLSNTPNHVALAEKIAAIEGGEAALVAASGMAAISATFFALLRAGDHALIQRDVYGGTHDLVTQDLPRFGIEHTFVDGADPASWERALRPSTKILYVESISNPLVNVADLSAAAAFCRERGLTSIVDNTFASPINLRPIERGVDLVIHSATKYLNGHSDIVAGAVVGERALVEPIKRAQDHLGGSLDPHACSLLHRGMKTLALRVRHQNESALRLARALSEHPKVTRVYYPFLPSHPDHDRARELLTGAGGVLSFEIEGGVEAAQRLIEGVTIPIHAPSLGSVETLITRPSTTSHAGLRPEERRALGISDALIRVSVGLESPDDLIDDFSRALG